jgi:hypothetical protein
VLGLCARAGLASVGVVAIDGTTMAANATSDANRDFGQIAREILAAAAEIDRREDEPYGTERGDELPEQLRTREGRRQALSEAKEHLARESDDAPETSLDGERPATVKLGPGQFVTCPQGRRAWVREGRRAVEAEREREGRPIAKTGPIGCLRRVGGWRKSSTSSTRRTPPMTRGGREGSLRTGRGGWPRGWSSGTSLFWCRPG